MTERLADAASPIRASSIQSLANSVKEAMSLSVKDAVNSAHSKAVANEARSAAKSAVKSAQTALHSLREGGKQSAGVKKVPGILANNSHMEECTSAVDSAAMTVDRVVTRDINTLLEREAAVEAACASLGDDILLLNAVWHKLMTPPSKSRACSQVAVAEDV